MKKNKIVNKIGILVLAVTLTVKVVVSKIYIFCSCRSSDIVLYLT